MEDWNTVANLCKIFGQASVEAENFVTALHTQPRSGVYSIYLRGLFSLKTEFTQLNSVNFN